MSKTKKTPAPKRNRPVPMQREIVVRGARAHNLKNIDVTLPRDQLVVITGLSGSGKSSLAFDTIYAEGQRRYVESLSVYARQFLEQMEKPDVDSIDGLSPAISIDQRRSSSNPRSTVGTVTEIYDYLRLLFARVGKPFCYACGKEITAQSPSQIVDQIMSWGEGTKIHLMANLAKAKKGSFQKELLDLRKKGFSRVKIDGEVYELQDKIELKKTYKHTIDVFIDRIVVKEKSRRRIADSVETALNQGQGIIKVEILNGKAGPKELMLSTQAACIDCGISFPEIAPRMFSFNNPVGACETCDGLGTKKFIDPERIIPNPNLSIREGAIAPWKTRYAHFHLQTLDAVAQHYKFELTTPWHKLPAKIKQIVLHGSGEDALAFSYDMQRSNYSIEKSFEGVVPSLTRRYHESESEDFREELEKKYMGVLECPSCQGARLKKEALWIKVDGANINDISSKTVSEAFSFFQLIELSERDAFIAKKILQELRSRLAFLVNVGLEYLTLDRMAGTLSGGEAQRIRLATQIGAHLMGVLYVLDEPSIGLHQRDNDRLLETLKHLRDLGNTVLVVEHDEDTMLGADYLIDMGPGAGRHGGEVIACGTPQDVIKNPRSLTGQYLSGKKVIPLPAQRREVGASAITLRGVQTNNLQKVDVTFPLKGFVCVTGVSGSGKSSLVLDTLFPLLKQHLYKSKERAGTVDAVEGLHYLDKVIDIDQTPIGRTPRSNPATYTQIFTPIRELFADLPDAKLRGYKPGRFSFNVRGGRCEGCQGDGIIKIEMHFLPDVYVTCEQCNGKRYNRETLEIQYKGKSIAEVLEMTVNEALEFFDRIPAVKTKLKALVDVGLGYITLGQSATTLSGGEAQRIKLSRELGKRATGKTLYIFDEPTTGLHFEDVGRLIQVLQRLVDNGNSVIVIEHHLDVIKTADWIIDLGPEGGTKGGMVVGSGPPEVLVKVKESFTGKYLKKYLKQAAPSKKKATKTSLSSQAAHV